MQSSKRGVLAWQSFVLFTLWLGEISLPGQPVPAKPPYANSAAGTRAVGPDSNLSAGKPPQETPGVQLTPNEAAPLVKLVSPGLFEVGTVMLDKPHRTVSFPAVLNSSSGAVEYFLVTSKGKVHESILKTDAAPYHIHIAMLLLGAKSAGDNQTSGSGIRPSLGPIKNPSREAIPGDRVSISIGWKAGEAEVQHPAEELVFNQQTQSILGPGDWVYNGSCVIDGRFLADLEGSIVSLITDPVALLNNTGPGHDNDQIWTAATNNLPPTNVPLEVKIKLLDSLP